MPGPVPGAQCGACNSPGVALINQSIAEGKSDRAIGKAFGLGRNVIINHRRRAHPGVPLRGGSAPEEEPGTFQPSGSDSPREKLLAVIRQLEEEAAGGQLRVEVARELRIAYADLDKMGGGEAPAVVRVRDVEGLPELLAAMLRALEPFPEARLALAPVVEGALL